MVAPQGLSQSTTIFCVWTGNWLAVNTNGKEMQGKISVSIALTLHCVVSRCSGFKTLLSNSTIPQLSWLTQGPRCLQPTTGAWCWVGGSSSCSKFKPWLHSTGTRVSGTTKSCEWSCTAFAEDCSMVFIYYLCSQFKVEIFFSIYNHSQHTGNALCCLHGCKQKQKCNLPEMTAADGKSFATRSWSITNHTTTVSDWCGLLPQVWIFVPIILAVASAHLVGNSLGEQTLLPGV